jgi:hypothetical protein
MTSQIGASISGGFCRSQSLALASKLLPFVLIPHTAKNSFINCSNSPEPVAGVHRAKPQPRAQRTQPSWTPFSIQQQGSREKQGAKKDDAGGREPHHHSLSPGGGDERRDGYPRCQEQQQSTRPEQGSRAAQAQRRNPIRLRPFAPFKTAGFQWPFSRPYVEQIS